MDPSLITALSTLVLSIGGAVGGGAAFLIKRADRRREAREALLITHLTNELQARDKEIRELKKLVSIREQDGMRWLVQLHAHNVTPDPPHWTQPPEEATE